jgi:hypothetical protein
VVLRKRRRREKVRAPSTRNSHPFPCSEYLFPTGATRRRANPKHMQSICRRVESTGSCGAEKTKEAQKSLGSLHRSADRETPILSPEASFCSPRVPLGGEPTLGICHRLGSTHSAKVAWCLRGVCRKVKRGKKVRAPCGDFADTPTQRVFAPRGCNSGG